MSVTSETRSTERMSRKQVVAIFATVIVLWAATPIVMACLVGLTLVERGQAGDLFGSVNALFSGLAFAGVIRAIAESW